MSNILKLVATVGIQYAEQTTVLAEICLKFYLESSRRSDIPKESSFTRQVNVTSTPFLVMIDKMILVITNSVVSLAIKAITEAKDKLTKFVDNEEDTYPVKMKMDLAITAMTKNAKSYGVGLITDLFHLIC